mgnify:CR=1 FL=1
MDTKSEIKKLFVLRKDDDEMSDDLESDDLGEKDPSLEPELADEFEEEEEESL